MMSRSSSRFSDRRLVRANQRVVIIPLVAALLGCTRAGIMAEPKQGAQAAKGGLRNRSPMSSRDSMGIASQGREQSSVGKRLGSSWEAVCFVVLLGGGLGEILILVCEWVQGCCLLMRMTATKGAGRKKRNGCVCVCEK